MCFTVATTCVWSINVHVDVARIWPGAVRAARFVLCVEHVLRQSCQDARLAHAYLAVVTARSLHID